ncbi:MAG: SDR family oxidoreductase [Pleurocapsa sp. MO_226.B13]|nr:SDR family oxidoreductase [Pleurocapsa sp. MO_226.B13]
MIFPEFSLEGKVALVTGGGRGLGLEIARAFASYGALVLINGRNYEKLICAIETINSTSVKESAFPMQFDIADELAVQNAFAEIRARYKRLDILVNNVGMRDRRELFELEIDAVRRLIDTDLVAPFNLCREAAKIMKDNGEGRIINITSIVGSIAGVRSAAYTIAKGGLESLTRTFAAELGVFGITVNGVAPGFFATESNAEALTNPEFAAWLGKRTSLGRWGHPAEIAGAVVFLASPSASYITGQILAVDGGYLSHL